MYRTNSNYSMFVISYFCFQFNYIGLLVLPSLRHCKSPSAAVRAEAVSFLYTLMRLNFSLVKKVMS